MRLTAKSEYGVLALMELARHEAGSPLSAREISEHQEIPARFLEQLFVSLRRAGLVTAARGARGGFTLAKDPAEISVLDIVEALEGPLETGLCDTERGAVCGRGGRCAASKVWDDATAALRQVFSAATLSSLVEDQRMIDQATHTTGQE